MELTATTSLNIWRFVFEKKLKMVALCLQILTQLTPIFAISLPSFHQGMKHARYLSLFLINETHPGPRV